VFAKNKHTHKISFHKTHKKKKLSKTYQWVVGMQICRKKPQKGRTCTNLHLLQIEVLKQNTVPFKTTRPEKNCTGIAL
jgi:hypothetical protein